MKLASRMGKISSSPTMAIKVKEEQMKKAGIDVIGLGAGEPDFDTPDFIKDAAVEAIKQGFTKYTPEGGTLELKQAVCEKLLRDNGLSYKDSEVIISCGAKHSLYNIALALFEQGDEVIIPAPYWVTYPEQIKLADAKPVIVPTEEADGFLLRIDTLERAITPRTKAVIVNTPSNPTGAVYDKRRLEEIAECALRHNIIIISDECYERIIYGQHVHYSMAGLGPEVKAMTLTVNAVSKTYSMTGWRIGYTAGPEWVIKAMHKLQGQTTSNPTSIAQKASVAALRGDQTVVTAMVREFERRRDYIVDRLNMMPGISCRKPDGAFYCFPNCSRLFNRQCATPQALTEFLLEHARIAVVPGEGFGSDDHIRLSYVIGMEKIRDAMDRMEAAVKDLARP